MNDRCRCEACEDLWRGYEAFANENPELRVVLSRSEHPIRINVYAKIDVPTSRDFDSGFMVARAE